MKLAIIDYGAGNQKSVENALLLLGYKPQKIQDASDISEQQAIILPGVGSFGDCSRALRTRGISTKLNEHLQAGRPFLGICVGYQILFAKSEESPEEKGLGYFDGEVKKFVSDEYKIPHMGWNQVDSAKISAGIFKNIKNRSYFYFAHSFYPHFSKSELDDSGLELACADYIVKFPCFARRGRVAACQFHPEKSQKLGLRFIQNWLDLVLNE